MAKRPTYPSIENPSTKLYWRDLHEEPGLKMCSLAARGLWTFHMLAIMAGAGGYLAILGEQITIEELSTNVGKPLNEVQSAFAELEKYKVFSRDRRGTPYNRRMIRGRKKASSSRENGQNGGRPKYRKINDNSDSETYSKPMGKPNGEPKTPPTRAPLSFSQDSQKEEDAYSETSAVNTAARKSPDPNPDPFKTRTAPSPFIVVGKRVAELMGVEDDPRWMGNFSMAEVWLNRGFDPDRDIYPTVISIMAKRGERDPPTNLKYFDNAIAQAHADNTRTIAEPAHVTRNSTGGPKKLTPSERAQAVFDRAAARQTADTR